MRKFTPDQKQSFENLARQYPELGVYLSAWRQQELDALPYAATETLAVLRGRVQSLTELQQGLFGRNETP